MPLYKCPFCKLFIEDGIDNLIVHRQPDGECDTELYRLEAEKNDVQRAVSGEDAGVLDAGV